MAIPSLAMIPSGYKDGKVYSVLPTNGDGDFTFSRGSSATRVNKDGLIETVTGDTPRLDYSDSSCPSLLLEPSRINAINYSNDYTLWSNTQFTINSNSVTSPQGITNGTKIVPSTSNTEKSLDIGGFVRTSGQYISHSVYAKASGYNFLYISNSASRLYAVYDLQQGLVIYSNSNGTDFNNHSASIELFGNGWYRCKLIGQAQSSVGSYFRISCGANAVNSSTAGLFEGDGTSGIEVYGSQVELNASYETSYIPTNGAIATRLAESANVTGLSGVFGSSSSTAFLEIDIPPSGSLSTTGVWPLTAATDISNFISVCQFDSGSTTPRIALYIGGAAIIDQYLSTPLSAGTHKVCLAYEDGRQKLFIDGFEELSLTASFNYVEFTKLSINDTAWALGNNGGPYSNKQTAVFPTALTDSECIALTS